MSLLSTLNSPPLVAGTGAILASSFPFLESLVLNGSVPVTTLKVVNLLAYVLNIVSVSVPGRMDGQNDLLENDEVFSVLRGRTLVAPAGWAFAIWGPIFVGELIFVISQFFAKSSSLNTAITGLSVPFTLAQLFQSLWCASFRPKYKDGPSKWISAFMLGGTAYSMSKAHAVFANKSFTFLQYAFHFLPMTLHFGWTTAATLVNINGSLAMDKSVSDTFVEWTGHLSVLAASGLGLYITFTRSSPLYGGVIAWALSAVADSMKKRLNAVKGNNTNDDRKKKNINTNAVRNQYWLSRIGASLNFAGALYSQFMNANTSKVAP